MKTSLPNGLPKEVELSFLPPHIIERARALAKPVEVSDEPLLVETIVDALRKDKDASYRDILNGLHGRNGHSASLWKDYYLDHKRHIDVLVRTKKKEGSTQPTVSKPLNSQREAGPSTVKKPVSTLPTIKKPALKYESPVHSLRRTHMSASSPLKRARSKAVTSKEKRLTSPAVIPASGSRRTTLNSLTTFDPVFNSQLPPPHTEIKIPDLPSREPSPPTTIVANNLGHKFTQEDRDFFIKFIQRRFMEDPTMQRKDICDRLAEKARAPHHPSSSWNSYWSNNHDLPDKIANAAANGLWPFGSKGQGESSISAGVVRNSVLKRPNYRESSSGEDDEDDNIDDFYSSNHEEGDDDDSDDHEPVRRYTESQMSESRTSFNEADMYMVAKYVADFPHFEYATNGERWGPFGERHPQRTDKSWAEYFRRYEKDVRRLVKRIERQDLSQCVQPSGSPPHKKRREE